VDKVSRAGLVSGVGRERSSARGVDSAEPAARDFGMELEFHQLEMQYEHLHLQRPERERRLLASLAEKGQQVPIVVVALFEDRAGTRSSMAQACAFAAATGG
jgi:hypothetical protein